MRGREYRGIVIPVGEIAHFKVLTDDKFEDRWVKGVWIGRSEETDEHFFSIETGWENPGQHEG